MCKTKISSLKKNTSESRMVTRRGSTTAVAVVGYVLWPGFLESRVYRGWVCFLPGGS